MTQSEVRNNSHVISGLLIIYNSPALVLFNSEVIHSFISLSHAKFLNRKIEPIESGLLICMSSGEVFCSRIVV